MRRLPTAKSENNLCYLLQIFLLKLSSQRMLTYFVQESIIELMTSCLGGWDSAALFMLNKQQIYFFVKSQPAKQEVSHTSHFTVS